VLAEGDGADENADHGIDDGQGGQRPGQGSGLEGALHHDHPAQSQHDQGVGLPGRQGVDHAAVQEMADGLGQSCAGSVDHASAGGQQAGRQRAPRGPASQGRQDGGHDREEEQQSPGVAADVGPAPSGLGDHQEQGQAGDDQSRPRPVDRPGAAAVEGDAQGDGEEQSADQQRLDEHQGSVGQGDELQDKRRDVRPDAGQPHAPAHEAHEQPHP